MQEVFVRYVASPAELGKAADGLRVTEKVPTSTVPALLDALDATRVYLVERNEVVRIQGAEQLVKIQPGVELIAVAASGEWLMAVAQLVSSSCPRECHTW